MIFLTLLFILLLILVVVVLAGVITIAWPFILIGFIVWLIAKLLFLIF